MIAMKYALILQILFPLIDNKRYFFFNRKVGGFMTSRKWYNEYEALKKLVHNQGFRFDPFPSKAFLRKIIII